MCIDRAGVATCKTNPTNCSCWQDLYQSSQAVKSCTFGKTLLIKKSISQLSIKDIFVWYIWWGFLQADNQSTKSLQEMNQYKQSYLSFKKFVYNW